jgi:RNA polymerase sigma-70 factor (ECF subfamily)
VANISFFFRNLIFSFKNPINESLLHEEKLQEDTGSVLMQSEDANQKNDQSTREFVHLMSASQMNIYAYIMSIVGNASDADDIMQDTSAFMWERFSEFKSGTDFVSWGISIAYYKIKEFRKTQTRCQFSDKVLEVIHNKAQQNLGDVTFYIEKLNECLSKLQPADLALVKLRYESGNSIKRISIRINKTVQAVYLKMSRIHGMLSRCIKRAIIQEPI